MKNKNDATKTIRENEKTINQADKAIFNLEAKLNPIWTEIGKLSVQLKSFKSQDGYSEKAVSELSERIEKLENESTKLQADILEKAEIKKASSLVIRECSDFIESIDAPEIQRQTKLEIGAKSIYEIIPNIKSFKDEISLLKAKLAKYEGEKND